MTAGARPYAAQVLRPYRKASGELSGSWRTVGHLWVGLAGVTGRELEVGGQLVAEASHRLALPPLAGGEVELAEADRLRVLGRTFEVVAVVDPDGRGREPFALAFEVR